MFTTLQAYNLVLAATGDAPIDAIATNPYVVALIDPFFEMNRRQVLSHGLASNVDIQTLQPDINGNSRTRFDLDLINPEKDPSVDCIGIDGSITSTRADLIIGDDCENIDNSCSVPLRENLLWKLSEFQAVLHPAGRFLRGKDGFVMDREEAAPKVARLPESCQLVIIGTYQHLKSIYLPTTDPEHPLLTVQRLVLPALKRSDDPQALPVEGMEGRYVSAWPERFSTRELLERRKDGAKFALDYLCDVRLINTAERVIKLDRIPQEQRTPRFSYCFVDPAQGGDDETVAVFGGPDADKLYVSDLLTWRCDTPTWAAALVKRCRERNVVELHVEAQAPAVVSIVQQEVLKTGGGLLVRTINPKRGKLDRVVCNLEPALNSGRVVFNPSILQNEGTKAQLEGLTRSELPEPNDRVDAMAHLVAAFAHHLGHGRVSPLQSARFG